MSIYAIILQKPNTTVWQTIREKWPDRHYIWHDHTAFIAPTGITTAIQVGYILGLNMAQTRAGVVVEMTPSHSGFAEAGLVAWLNKARKESA